jgi:DNA-binding CsgD family transcriptional regulator
MVLREGFADSARAGSRVFRGGAGCTAPLRIVSYPTVVLVGRTGRPFDVVVHPADHIRFRRVRPDIVDRLTSAESLIIRGLADGLQSKELASVIDRSVPTVEFTIRKLYMKLSAKSRAHLVAIAFRDKLLDEYQLI